MVCLNLYEYIVRLVSAPQNAVRILRRPIAIFWNIGLELDEEVVVCRSMALISSLCFICWAEDAERS